MSAIPIAAAAAELNMSPKKLQRLVAQRLVPVVRRGGKGRNNATLVNLAAVRAALAAPDRAAQAENRTFADSLIETLAQSAVQLFRSQSGPHKGALAANLLLQWVLSANVVRRQCGLPDITPAEYPDSMTKMDSAAGYLRAIDTLTPSIKRGTA